MATTMAGSRSATQANQPTGQAGNQVSGQQASMGTSTGNVGKTERWASLVGGGALAAFGLSRGSLAGLGLAALGGFLLKRGATGKCELYSALGMNTAGNDSAANRGVMVERVVTIHKSPEELYRFWRRVENLPKFMGHLQSVTETGGNRSHWVAQAPMAGRVEWDADIVDEVPNESISWRSVPGSMVDTAGVVRFQRATGNRGTVVHVIMRYAPPAGKIGAAVAWLFGQSGDQQVKEDLRRLKRMLEAGEIPSTLGQPSGRGRESWQQTGIMVLEDRISRFLGYFSIGLGLAEVLVPNGLGKMIGVGRHPVMLPALGAREITTGIGILMGKRPAGWLWGRVAGDVMDISLLLAAMKQRDAEPGRIIGAIAAVLGVTVMDLLASLELSRDPQEAAGLVDGKAGRMNRGGASS